MSGYTEIPGRHDNAAAISRWAPFPERECHGKGLLGRLGGRKHTPAREFAVMMNEEEWQRKLSPAQYQVLREHGTERAGSSPSSTSISFAE